MNFFGFVQVTETSDVHICEGRDTKTADETAASHRMHLKTIAAEKSRTIWCMAPNVIKSTAFGGRI